jgi:hypothetical protein
MTRDTAIRQAKETIHWRRKSLRDDPGTIDFMSAYGQGIADFLAGYFNESTSELWEEIDP